MEILVLLLVHVVLLVLSFYTGTVLVYWYCTFILVLYFYGCLYLFSRVAAVPVGCGGIRFASNFQPDYTWPLQTSNQDIFKNHLLWIIVLRPLVHVQNSRLWWISQATDVVPPFVGAWFAWLVCLCVVCVSDIRIVCRKCSSCSRLHFFCHSSPLSTVFDEVAMADLELGWVYSFKFDCSSLGPKYL